MTNDPSNMKTRPRIRACWLMLLLVCLSSVGSVRPGRAQPAEAPDSCDEDAECKRLAKEGLEHSKGRRFDAAQRAYEAAYAQRPAAKLLFNLARVLHKADRLAKAITYYQRYLDAGAEGLDEQRRKAQQFLAQAREQLQQEVASTAQLPADPAPPITPPIPPEPSPPAPVYRKWWLWTAIGITAAGIGVGVGLGVAARRPDLTGAADARPFGN